MKNDRIAYLMEIGLKELESEVYLQLLKEPGITGYRISKLLKKTKPTVYKVLETLQEKGLIISNEVAKNQVFTALPIQQYLDHKESEFQKNRKKVLEALKDIKNHAVKPGLYPLERIDQVYSKIVNIINSAQKKIVLTCCTLQNNDIIAAINAATSRGVKVLLESYLKPEVQNCDHAIYTIHSVIHKEFTYNWLEVFVDGNEYVIGLLTKDGKDLYKAIWCNEPYLAMFTYNSNVTSFILTITRDMLAKNISSREIQEKINSLIRTYYHGINIKEITELLDKYF